MNPISLPFRFRIQYHEFRNTLRPLLQVVASLDGRDVHVPMLVDTGSDLIVLPDAALEMLALNRSRLKHEQIATATGWTDVYRLPPVRLSFPELDSSVSFIAAVVVQPTRAEFGLLGREVFDYLRICFSHHDGHAFYVSCNA